MTIKNILCAAAIGCVFGNQIKADSELRSLKQEEAIHSIETELLAIHKKISFFKKELALAKKQKEKDWDELTICWDKKKDEAKNLSFYQFHRIDCSSQEALFINFFSLNKGIDKDGYNKANTPVSNAASNLFNANSQYNDFQQALKRCKRHNDTDCLDDLAKEIGEWNKNN